MRHRVPLTLLAFACAAGSAVGQTVQHAATPQRFLSIPVQAALAGRVVDLDCRAPVGPTTPVCAVAFSPDGKTLAAAGYREVALWDLVDGRLARRLGAGGLGDTAHCLAFANGGKTLAVGEGIPGRRGAVELIDVETGRVTAHFDQPRDVVNAVAYSPDEKLLAIASADGAAYVWDASAGKTVAVLREHKGWVLAVAFSADGKLLATGGADRTARLWQTSDWEPGLVMAQIEPVSSIAFSADGQELALAVGGPNECGIRVREIVTGKVTRFADMGFNVPLSLLWNGPSKTIYVGAADRSVRVLTTPPNRLSVIRSLVGHGGRVYAVALSPDGARVASGSGDGTLKLWNVRDGKPLATLAQLAPGTDRWLIVTPQGFMATSAEKDITWRPLDPLVRLEKLGAVLLNSDAVRQALSGRLSAPAASGTGDKVRIR